MLTIISGVPGSGKTYYAVKLISEMSLEKQSKVLHNIDGLKIGKSFHEYEGDTGVNVQTLFCNSYHEKQDQYRGYTLVIDEAQTLFSKRFSDRNVLTFFEKHRHYGLDIILLTQDYKLLCPDISLHCEYQLRATSDTANPIPFFFIYRKMVGFESIGTVFVRKKKKVFDLYKTADFDQTKVAKKSKPMLLILGVALVLIIIALFTMRSWLTGMGKGEHVSSVQMEVPGVKKLNTDKQGPQKKKIFGDNIEQTENITKGYSESLVEKIGGVLMPLSILTDIAGRYIVFQNQLFPVQMWPYQIIKTRFGYSSIVPPDVYEFGYLKKLAETKESLSRDPNEKYYYKGGGQGQGVASLDTKSSPALAQ